jgi:aryl-alcohol dehydrogenase-like predicted oxidoreductase
MTSMPPRRIGGMKVSAVGLGAMLLSLAGRPDEAGALRTIHAALDAGITLIDTADAYCLDGSEVGHNERLVAKALAAWPGDRDRVLVATKGGHTRPGREWGLDGRPEYLRRACEASLRALGVEAIGLYQFHRPDPKVPFAESVGALAELRAAGKVRMVGLSNVSVEQIQQARRIVEVAASRTSSRRGSAVPRASWPGAPPTASPSCRGARSAAWAGAASSPSATRRSPRWPPVTASPRSRSRWRGSWPRPRW